MPNMPSERDQLVALITEASFQAPGYCEAAADAVLAEFLVVRRCDIVDTEYGWRYAEPYRFAPVHYWADNRVDALDNAASHRRLEMAKNRQPTAEAIQRPVLPWSVIPLPEDGEA